MHARAVRLCCRCQAWVSVCGRGAHAYAAGWQLPLLRLLLPKLTLHALDALAHGPRALQAPSPPSCTTLRTQRAGRWMRCACSTAALCSTRAACCPMCRSCCLRHSHSSGLGGVRVPCRSILSPLGTPQPCPCAQANAAYLSAHLFPSPRWPLWLLAARTQDCAVKYELPGSSPPTFVDLINDADVGNMWDVWREHCAMQAATGACCGARSARAAACTCARACTCTRHDPGARTCTHARSHTYTLMYARARPLCALAAGGQVLSLGSFKLRICIEVGGGGGVDKAVCQH